MELDRTVQAAIFGVQGRRFWGILIAEPFAPADAVVVVEPAVVRDHALRVKRAMEVLTGVGDQWG